MDFSRRVPEIFIIGTMKGGTTILFDYISSHPRVVPCASKEVHYFSLHINKGLDWYLEQFPERPQDVLSIDASPTYFDVTNTYTIPVLLHNTAPESKLILIVRDPIERAISHFAHLRQISHRDKLKDVDVNDFFSTPIERCFAQDSDYGFLLGQILNFSLYYRKYLSYIHIFGRRKILVIKNEDLRVRPKDVMCQVFAHCGLEWADSDLFGKEAYSTGSNNIAISDAVYAKLANLLYPNYKNFCRASGIYYAEKPR